jgi:hypothetical protein
MLNVVLTHAGDDAWAADYQSCTNVVVELTTAGLRSSERSKARPLYIVLTDDRVPLENRVRLVDLQEVGETAVSCGHATDINRLWPTLDEDLAHSD